MTRYDLKPFESLGAIRRGHAFADVQALFPGRTESFKRNQFSPHKSLIVGATTFIVNFSKDGIVRGVELFAEKGIDLRLSDMPLMAGTNRELRQSLEALGEAVEASDYGIRCPLLGLSTYHPNFGSDDYPEPELCPIDAIHVSLDPAYIPG